MFSGTPACSTRLEYISAYQDNQLATPRAGERPTINQLSTQRAGGRPTKASADFLAKATSKKDKAMSDVAAARAKALGDCTTEQILGPFSCRIPKENKPDYLVAAENSLVEATKKAKIADPPDLRASQAEGEAGMAARAACFKAMQEIEAAAAVGAAKRAEQARKQENEAKMRHREKVAARMTEDEHRGYHRMSISDLIVDGPKMVGSKVAISGIMAKMSNFYILSEPGAGSRYDIDTAAMLVLDDASHEFRKNAIECARSGVDGDPACAISAVLGTVGVCTYATLVGSRLVPCLNVEDGWGWGETTSHVNLKFAT